MIKPKALSVSIVIPVFNEENHLKRCLTAIKNQTVKPDEVIVVDNNSTDRSVAIAKKFMFVTVIKESKQGKHFARNRGFNAVNSTIIARIDADTRLPRSWINQIKTFYAEPNNTDKGLSSGCYFYNIRLPHFYGWTQGGIAFRFNKVLLGHYILYGSNMALPNKIWKEVKAKTNNRLDIHEDVDLAIQVHRAGYKIVYNPKMKVGVQMRRVRSNQSELWENLMLWPQTLKVNGLKTWVFGWIGAVIIWMLWPIGNIMEWIATKVFRKPPIVEA